VPRTEATIDGVRLSYVDEGPTGAASGLPVFCVHGLTRNAHDFDAVLPALAPHRRVIAVDVPGRGQSAWLDDKSQYNNPFYAQLLLKLLDHLKLDQVDWIGTSMGGLIAMVVAVTAPARIRRLVLNDIGPFIPKASLDRIAIHLTATHEWADLAGAEAHFRKAYAPFGRLSDDEWRHFTETRVAKTADGRITTSYDPGIAQAFQGVEIKDINLWPLWAEIRVPVLLLRGADSDLLLRPTALGMVAAGPVQLREFADTGHAPALRARDQLDAITGWVLA
jgi:pimeloyl-ACP methyl ester carboxylesterase